VAVGPDRPQPVADRRDVRRSNGTWPRTGRACRGQDAARSRTTLTISTFQVPGEVSGEIEAGFPERARSGGISGPATVSASRHAGPSGDRPAERTGDRRGAEARM